MNADVVVLGAGMAGLAGRGRLRSRVFECWCWRRGSGWVDAFCRSG
jgi:cation diffusion facilitator CzcD-associated flavoprotein CzcO